MSFINRFRSKFSRFSRNEDVFHHNRDNETHLRNRPAYRVVHLQAITASLLFVIVSPFQHFHSDVTASPTFGQHNGDDDDGCVTPGVVI